MQDDQRPLVIELAYILHKRNLLEIRRRRAKSKINYYEDIKKNVKAYKADTATLNHLKRTVKILDNTQTKRLESQIQGMQDKLESYKISKNSLIKWLDRVSELNKRILKHRAEYMKARYETAKLTCQTRKRVARLTNILSARINYQMGTGFVNYFTFGCGKKVEGATICEAPEFEAMFNEFDANKAIDKALRSNGTQ